MTPRTVIITGANSGIGKAAAEKFAADGHHVIMACRNPERSEPAREEVAAAAKNGQVDLMQLDVSSFGSVRAFCDAFKGRYGRLDALIHNAGYFEHGAKGYQFSEDGIERTFATNTFGPFLMTELLLDTLEKSDDPRVLNAGTTNIMNFFDDRRQIEFDNLRGEYGETRPYSVYKMYGDSKMGLLLLTYMMAEAYRSRGVKVNYLVISATRVSRATLRKLSPMYRILGILVMNANPFALSPAQMAERYYRICTSDAFKDVTGAAIDKNLRIMPKSESDGGIGRLLEVARFSHIPPYAFEPEHIARMWETAKAVTGLQMDSTISQPMHS